MWWDHDAGNGWVWMVVLMIGVWVLLAALVFVLARGLPATRTGEPLDPRQVLDMRLARGEIDGEEYRERLDAMSRRPGPPGQGAG